MIFIRNGYVDKVYEVKMTVKLPTGLKEAELSRPVIEVRDFLTGELEYEIYTFGEQTVVVPVKKRGVYGEVSGEYEKVMKHIQKMLPEADIVIEKNTIVVVIPRDMIRSYNKKVKRLRRLENKYNVPIKVRIA